MIIICKQKLYHIHLRKYNIKTISLSMIDIKIIYFFISHKYNIYNYILLHFLTSLKLKKKTKKYSQHNKYYNKSIMVIFNEIIAIIHNL
jgi:hypothetical protein